MEKLTDGHLAAARTTARQFMRTWLSGRRENLPRRAWLDRVRPHVTPELLAGIRLIDPAELPHGRTNRIEVAAAGAFGAEISVRLSTRGVLVVRLVDNGGRWLVSDIQQERR